jgi:hypothetical protein
MTLPLNAVPLLMAILLMALVVWAVPGNARLLLVLPVVIGAAWAIWRLCGPRTPRAR